MTPSSIIIILPYFGPLPSTFGPWLRSAELNTSVDFLIVTDQEVVSESPNITVRKTTLQQLRSLTMVKLDTYVALEKPYKLCDLKPFYGKIFSDDVNGHDFWGYCDCDMVFGDMRVFLTEDILSTHNSILSLGHLHLQRTNDPLYDAVIESCKSREGKSWKEVLAHKEYLCFDEMPFGVSAHYYFKHPELSWTGFTETGRCYSSPTMYRPLYEDTYNNYGLYLKSYYNDLSNRFPCWQRIPTEPLKHMIYRKEGVKLYAIGKRKKEGICQEEILYVHIMKRQIDVMTKNKDNYIIIPNKIISDRTISRFFLLLTMLQPAPYIAFYKQRLINKLKRIFRKQ